MTFADIIETLADAGTTTGKSIKKNANKLASYDKEDILSMIGLEPKRSTTEVMLPAVGFFAVGVLAGIGLGMLFAPKPGYELREDLNEQVNKVMKRPEDTVGTQNTGDANPVI